MTKPWEAAKELRAATTRQRIYSEISTLMARWLDECDGNEEKASVIVDEVTHLQEYLVGRQNALKLPKVY